MVLIMGRIAIVIFSLSGMICLALLWPRVIFPMTYGPNLNTLVETSQANVPCPGGQTQACVAGCPTSSQKIFYSCMSACHTLCRAEPEQVPGAGLSPRIDAHLPPTFQGADSLSSRSTKTVLVTGISGMIGSYVAKALCAKGGYAVVGLVRWRSDLMNLAGILHEVRLVYGDITDSQRVRDIVAEVRPDIIFHFAAQAINGVSFSNPEITMRVNVMGSLNLFEAVRDGVTTKVLHRAPRILLAGSSTEYGATSDEWQGPIPENAPQKPVSQYGVSKVSMESLGFQYWRTYGVPVVVARFFIQVAAGGTTHLALQEFCRQIAMVERGMQKPILYHGNLESYRDMTDVEDAAPVVVQLAEAGVPGEAYNVGSGVQHSISELVMIAVSQATVNITLQADPSRMRAYDEKTLLADIGKLQALTGWTPSPKLSRIVAQVLQYWRREVALRYPLPRTGPEESVGKHPHDAETYVLKPSADPSAKKPKGQVVEQMLNPGIRAMEHVCYVVRTYHGECEVVMNLDKMMNMFVPLHVPFVVVLDSESSKDHECGDRIAALSSRYRVVYEQMPAFLPSLKGGAVGYARAVWSMFYSDKHAEHCGNSPTIVGLLDTDVAFFSVVTPESVFHDVDATKIIVAQTSGFNKFLPDPRFLNFSIDRFWMNMNVFPAFLWKDTFSRFRKYIMDTHNTSFENAFVQHGMSRTSNFGRHEVTSTHNVLYAYALRFQSQRYVPWTYVRWPNKTGEERPLYVTAVNAPWKFPPQVDKDGFHAYLSHGCCRAFRVQCGSASDFDPVMVYQTKTGGFAQSKASEVKSRDVEVFEYGLQAYVSSLGDKVVDRMRVACGKIPSVQHRLHR
eukprot:TRINITY_DN62916_c0_g1_i1.p1 TRINITY_DN62916_c0_g1~~TRINITY_DN62916_c0_g1_i1.p1  ORF type:complete len:860 (+),score=29.21 TRINITY_DN62916_c0_g1_i1:45-2582(+)